MTSPLPFAVPPAIPDASAEASSITARRRFGRRLASFVSLALSPPGSRLMTGMSAALGSFGAAPSLVSAQGTAADHAKLAAGLLNRLAFGPRPGDLATVAADPKGWIEAQLHPAALPLPVSLTSRLQDNAFLDVHPLELVRRYRDLLKSSRLLQQETAYPAPSQAAGGQVMASEAMAGKAAPAPAPAPRTEVAEFVRSVALPAIEGRLLRALESPQQLQEVMVDFWFNHFNVFQGKGILRVLTGHYEHYAIRPFALGRFRDLLGATARHPAMLFYLDNTLSVAPGTGQAGGKPRGLNENYARELMELHTLGVDGGYSQSDVTELARMLTGWMIQPLNGRFSFATQSRPGTVEDMPGFWFNARVHDQGEKQWLGHRVLPQGQAEGEFALDVLARHPATARHVAFKLAQYFVADQPDPALVSRLAREFQAHDGQIIPLLRALLDSPEFAVAAVQGSKFKTPYQFTLSVLRASGETPERLQPLAAALAAQGMPLYGCQTPDGYKNTEASWLNPDAMSKRINFATAVASGRFGNAAGAALVPEHLLTTLGPLTTDNTRKLARESEGQPVLASAMILAGPGMMRR